MTQTNSAMQVANLNRVINVATIESKLPNYSNDETGTPVTVTFHQEFKRKETVTLTMEQDKVKVDDEGNPILEPMQKQIKGKMVTVFVPVYEGTEKVKVRVETGQELNDERRYDVRFICKDASELRQEIGEALNEFYGILETGEGTTKQERFARSQKLHMSFNFGGKLLSTKFLSYGGIKLSKVFEKGTLKRELFAANLCKPVFEQLKKVASGEANKGIEIDDTILTALNFTKK